MKLLKRLKKELAFFIAAVLLFSVFPIPPKTVRAADEVNIPDEALRAAIKAELNLSESEDITREQLESLMSLNVNAPVSNLTGIEYCTKLGSLELKLPSDNALDLTPLKDLSMLRYLILYSGKVSSLPQTQYIEALRISNCEVLDPASISNLTGLKELYCNQTAIAELPDCSRMNSLVNLWVTDTSALTDISGISGCTSLRNVTLDHCSKLTDISPLRGLKLIYLSLEGVKVTSENQTSYMETIASLSELQQISLFNTGLKDEHVSMFDNLNSLERLVVSSNQLTSAGFLVSHKNTLKRVALSYNPISDSAPLGELTNLEAIEISVTQITDFSFLAKLPDLTSTKPVKSFEWTEGSPARPSIDITDSYQAGTGTYTIQNPFKDADGNYIAPEASDKYSYNEGTGEITVSASSVSTWPICIDFPYTYTTAKGEQLKAKPCIYLTLKQTTPLAITAQPQDVTLTEGESTTLKVVASGSGTLSYQWYKGSAAISGATASSYTISNAVLSDAGSYTVKVTDKNGSITSDPAEVTVNAIPLKITAQPQNVSITEGENTTLSVVASGSGTLSYQWYKGNAAISGATSSSLTISNAALSDAGSYTVEVTDKNGNITSNPAVVTVNAIPLKITAQPQNVSITEGENTTLSVVASGSGTLSYQWYKGNAAINGATASSYTISNAVLSDAGSYTVEVTDKNGNVTSNPAVVSVTAISLLITAQPQNVSITEGENATLTVSASGSGTLSYQWYKGGDAISGATSSSLVLSNAALSDAGSYTVEVTDKNDSITSNPAVVTVTAIPLKITTQPVNTDITEGGNATLTVVASGSGTLSYQWFKNNTAISGAITSMLTISNAALSDAGSYTVKVTDNNGSITSNPAVVSVTAIPLEITAQPQNVSITEGENATLSVLASGSGALSYQWYKDDAAISGATASSLALNNAALSDAGSYTVEVTDKNGSITSNPAEVSVNAIPLLITTQPVNTDITEGGNATLTVLASGSGALSYQWYKDGAAISGASASSLALNNVALSDAGSYTVKVTDKNGSITSNPAVVTVKEKPTEPVTEPEKPTEPATEPEKPTEPATEPTEPVVEPTNPVVPTEAASEEYDEAEEEETGAAVSAKTSDTSPVVPVMVLLFVSGVVLCITVSDKKKRFH